MAKEAANSLQEPAQRLKDLQKQTESASDKALQSVGDASLTDSAKDGVQNNQNSDLPMWSCRVEGAPKDQQWTVGEIFNLVCDGPAAKFLSTELSFKEEKKSGYELRVLEVVKQTENELVMVATSYVPQPHKFEALFIQDQGESVVRVEPFNLPMKSVITDPQQKPFGPSGAVSLAYPVWIWIVLAVVLLATAFFGLFRMNRRAQMRRVIEELKQHNTALGAFNQFNKDLRTLGRKHIFGDEKNWNDLKKQRYLENLDQVFRMYLLREFYVPALDWSSGLVLRTVSKQDKRRYDRYGAELQKFLKELDRAKADVEKLQVHDCQQLTQMAKKVSQTIWRIRRV